jgi:hypothetical protein
MGAFRGTRSESTNFRFRSRFPRGSRNRPRVGRSVAQAGFLGQIFFPCQADREPSLRWIYAVHKSLYDAVVGRCLHFDIEGWAGTAEGILPSWIVLDDLYGCFKLAILDRIVAEGIVAAVAAEDAVWFPERPRRHSNRYRSDRLSQRHQIRQRKDPQFSGMILSCFALTGN